MWLLVQMIKWRNLVIKLFGPKMSDSDTNDFTVCCYVHTGTNCYRCLLASCDRRLSISRCMERTLYSRSKTGSTCTHMNTWADDYRCVHGQVITWAGEYRCVHAQVSTGVYMDRWPHGQMSTGVYMGKWPHGQVSTGVYMGRWPHGQMSTGVYMGKWPHGQMSTGVYMHR